VYIDLEYLQPMSESPRYIRKDMSVKSLQGRRTAYAVLELR